MLLSHKKNKNRSLPIIQLKNDLKVNLPNIKNMINPQAKEQLLPNYITPNIYPTITIMDNIKRRSQHRNYHIIYKKSNSLLKSEKQNKFKDFENIKIFKGKIVEISNNKECDNRNENELKISNEFKKRNLYLFRNNCCYSCRMDKDDIFSIRFNKKPQENMKQKVIHIINNQINQENTEFKYPRMICILKRNNFLHDEIMTQPWKYPDLFAK